MGKGNIRKQRQRRRELVQSRPPKQGESYELIDGNLSHYPVAFCRFHYGYMTEGLIATHKCRARHCPMLKTLEFQKKKVVTPDLYEDPKMVPKRGGSRHVKPVGH